ncbi:TonB-dependent receptor [Maribellus sp. YY47]|uniref:TonB-dependent receptor n=1 Tax=Maribellus sp. YY47 TaxID=2929486 RepID=UPI0020018F69|nr:TonB-dependent receptor [Maribellus sp. YY47]MCK3685804.1 TonB-dependent receptor [Maribellus sp. YY47]
MKHFYIVLLFLFFTQTINAQHYVKITDSKSGAPIEGVVLLSDHFSVQSDENGSVDIAGFHADEKILFKHSSYLSLTLTKEKIEKQGNVVVLVENPVRLDEIVVSVNRWEQSRAEVPQSIVSIPATDILHYNPQTTADLLGTGHGIFIQKSQMGGGSPMIRGFAANRLLIVVDGIRMNNAIYRSGNLQNVISIDANSLENTEVILGPGTVIYGSDALGGVMSFNTLTPRLSTSDKASSSGKIFTRYSSANAEKTIHGTYNWGDEKWAAVLSTTYTDYDDLRMGRHGPDEYLRPEYVSNAKFEGTDKIIFNDNDKIQKYTGYSQFNILGKVRYRPSEKFDLLLSANLSETGDIPRYDRLIVYRNNKLRYGEWYYGPQGWSMFSGQLVLHPNSGLADKINIQTAFQKYEESRYDRAINKADRNGRKENLSIFSANFDAAKYFDKQNEFFYGLESYYNLIDSKGTVYNLLTGNTESIPSRYPGDSDYGSAAAYVMYKHKWADKFILQAGTRYTYTWMSGDFSQQDYGFPFEGFNMKNSALIGNLGFVWHPSSDWQINLDASTGFRSPNIDDVAKVFDSEPGNVIVPNPDLKPEYSRTLDVEIKKTFAERASLEVGAFYTRLKDAMVRRDYNGLGVDSILYDGTLSKVEALVNADAADIYGGSVAFEFIFSPHLYTKHDLTITMGEDSDGYPVRHAPPTFGSSHLIYENHRWFADLYVMYNGEIAFEDLAPSEQDKPYLYAIDKNGNPYAPSWWTLNLKSNYKIHPKITLSAGVENIFDKRYRPYSSGVVAPGVNFIFSALFKI